MNCDFPWKTWPSVLRDSLRSPRTAASFRSLTPPENLTVGFTARPHRSASPHRGTARVTARRHLGEPGAPCASGCAATTCAAKSSGTARSPGKAGRSFASGDSRSSPQPTAALLAFDGSGAVHGQGSPTEDSNSVFATNADGEIFRISRHSVHLIGATIDGRVRWRAVTEQPAGPMAAGLPGTAVMLGKSLAWFKNEFRWHPVEMVRGPLCGCVYCLFACNHAIISRGPLA